MRAYFIPITVLKHIVLFSITVFLAHSLMVKYIAENELETVSLEYLQGKKVMIDAGHGGIDSGATYYGLQEKDITLEISFLLGEILTQNGVEVVYTRDCDVDYYTRGKGGKRNDLLTRVDMINQSGADAFISIHCNADKAARWSGAQIFYSDKLMENKVLAHTMQELLRKYPPNNKRVEKEDHSILILKSSNIPGVLVETGYLSNQKEAALLSDKNYQENMAKQIAKALAYHFHQSIGG